MSAVRGGGGIVGLGPYPVGSDAISRKIVSQLMGDSGRIQLTSQYPAGV